MFKKQILTVISGIHIPRGLLFGLGLHGLSPVEAAAVVVETSSNFTQLGTVTAAANGRIFFFACKSDISLIHHRSRLI